MPRDVQIRPNERVELHLGDKIPVPVRDYEMLVHKPMLNGVELIGDYILKLSDLENDAGYISIETDPTVPAWAKQPNKPVYTAEEIGAMPNTVVIPVRVSQLENDSGYYTKPAGGIPLSDFAPGVIPDFSSKIDMSMKGARGGVAELDQNGMVPSHQLPSYVDDVKTYSSIAMFPTIGEDDKIYIDKSTNKQYRWSGDIEVGYVPIASSIALGETAQTAYRGDRGKAAYDHAMAKGQAYTSGLYKIVTNQEGHIIEAVLVTKSDITALGIPGDMPDISDKADKTDTVLLTTLSNGRKANTTVGSKTIAWGREAEASGNYAVAIGEYPKASGKGSIAVGSHIQASAENAVAFGRGSKANGLAAFAVGDYTEASGGSAFAFGSWTEANGQTSKAGGYHTIVNGDYAFGDGFYLIIDGKYQNGIGIYNYPNGNVQYELHAADLPEWEIKEYRYGEAVKHTENDVTTIYVAHLDVPEVLSPLNDPYNTYWGPIEPANISHPELIPEWDPEGTYVVGDQVKQYYAGKTYYFGCNLLHPPVYVALTNGTFWHPQAEGSTATIASEYLELVGNGHGSKETLRSNARMLDVYGNEYLMGDVYVKCGANGDNGKKLITADDIPTIPVTDVQIDGTSILQNGIANIPVGNGSTYGVYKVGQGLLVNMGALEVQSAGNSNIKAGTADCYPIVPYRQHTSVFYGLSKLAGEDLKNATVTVGTYPDASKQAIQKLFGLDGILGDFENSAVASKAYTIGETFIYNGKRYRATAAIAISDVITPGTNCELEPLNLAYIPKNAIDEYSGLYVKSNGKIAILASDTNVIKAGANNSRPITAYTAKDAAFYGLAKAANDSTQVSSSNPVGTYTTEAKTAIQTMLGIEADIPLIEEVSGSTPSITGMPNVRYICGTCSLLTITPPASGSIVVRFTSGSTPTVLTVPNTVKFPAWFDYTSLEADTTYEIIITDGVYGGVMSWAA